MKCIVCESVLTDSDVGDGAKYINYNSTEDDRVTRAVWFHASCWNAFIKARNSIRVAKVAATGTPSDVPKNLVHNILRLAELTYDGHGDSWGAAIEAACERLHVTDDVVFARAVIIADLESEISSLGGLSGRSIAELHSMGLWKWVEEYMEYKRGIK